MKLRRAERKKVYVKLGISAPSGCGKTFSSLLIARGLVSSWDKICLIDTEGSGDKYAGHPALGPYQVINLFECEDENRFSPTRWIEAMKIAADAGMEVVILDSASHEWQWCLELKERLGESIHKWKQVTPHHNKFIRAILQCPLHVIVCTRRKVEYAVTQDKKVEKLGMKSEMREGFEYELDVNIGLTRSHLATIEKDRAGIFHGRPAFVPTEAIGRELLLWSRAEEDKPDSEQKAASTDAPISVKNPRTVEWIRLQLSSHKVAPGLWDGIIATLDGTLRSQLRTRLEEVVDEAQGVPIAAEEAL